MADLCIFAMRKSVDRKKACYTEYGIRNRGRPIKPVGVAGLLNPGEDRWLTYSRASGDMVAISLPLSLSTVVAPSRSLALSTACCLARAHGKAGN